MKGPLELIHNGTVKLVKFLGWITKHPWKIVWAIAVVGNMLTGIAAAIDGQYDRATFFLLLAWFLWWMDTV